MMWVFLLKHLILKSFKRRENRINAIKPFVIDESIEAMTRTAALWRVYQYNKWKILVVKTNIAIQSTTKNYFEQWLIQPNNLNSSISEAKENKDF